MENKQEKTEYTKPIIVAQNNSNGSFAAGCPEKGDCAGTQLSNMIGGCTACQRYK